MKYHKITIKNLGPIENIENFEIRKVNMVIGESASGKSVLAKAVSIFNDKEFLGRLFFGGFEIKKDNLEQFFDIYFPKYQDYTIVYFYNQDCSIQVEKKKKKFIFDLSSGLEDKTQEIKKRIQDARRQLQVNKLYQELDNLLKKQEQNEEKAQESSSRKKNSEYIRIWKDVIKNIQFENIQKEKILTSVDTVDNIQEEFFKDLGILDTIFIPATRSFVSDFDNLRLEIMRPPYRFYREEGDISLYNFSEIYRRLIRRFENLDDSYNNLMKGQVKKILENKISFFKDKQELDISEISSGQKECFPILLILQDMIKFPKSCLLIIEEPEAHLFPKAQREIFEHIIKTINTSDSKILMTTHSPYMLMCANNLVEAQSKNYIPLQDKYISSESINVHKLFDGRSESIIDKDTNLIDGDYMESIEDEICEQYDDILNTPSK